MEFKEVKAVIIGYKEYFYTILGCEIKLEYNKRYKEFIIKKFYDDEKTYKDVIMFNASYLKSGIQVNLKNYSQYFYYFEKFYKKPVKFKDWLDEGFLQINSIEELNNLFAILEKITFFGGRKSL